MHLIQYSPKEVKKATNDLSAENLIGAGAFGQVYKGTLRYTPVAIKVFKKVNLLAMHSFHTMSTFSNLYWCRILTFLLDRFRMKLQSYQCMIENKIDTTRHDLVFFYRYRHPNVVQILGVCCEDELPAIVMEKMQGGSLYYHLHEVCL